MRRVYKYPLPVKLDDTTSCVAMPEGAAIIRFAGGDNSPVREPTIWALVDDDRPEVTRRFRVYGTGHPLPRTAAHVGTMFDGPFVWHVFELMGEPLPDGLVLPADAEAAYNVLVSAGFTRRPLADSEKGRSGNCGIVGVWVAPNDEPLSTEQIVAVATLQEYGFGGVAGR